MVPDFKIFLEHTLNRGELLMTTFKRNFDFEYNYMKDVSLNIKKYRKIAGITQEQLAVDVGRSYDFIRRLEFKKGDIGCSLDTLYKISVVLNQPIGNFFQKNEYKNNN